MHPKVISRKGAKKARQTAKSLICPARGYLFVAIAYFSEPNAPSGLPVKYDSIVTT